MAPSRKRQRSPTRHRLVGDHADAAEDVLDRLLRRQRDRDAAHAQTGDEAGHVEADVLQQHHHRDRGEEDLGGAAAEGYQRREAPAALSLEAVTEAVAEEVDQAQRGPGQRDHSQALEQPAQEHVHRLGERQHRQSRREEQRW